MGNILLTDTQSRHSIFRKGVIVNLDFWSTWVQKNQADIVALDREHSNIVRALLFALDIGQDAWANCHPLITDFSYYMERRGHWEVWLDILRRAIETAHQLKDITMAVTLSMTSARILQWQARFSQATRAYLRVIRLARQIEDTHSRARAYSNLGFLYTEQGYWWRAEILCRHALHIFEQLANDHGRAHTENHLGVLYTRQGCYELAQQHFENACTLWQTMGDDHGLMRGYINLGMLYLDQQQPETALWYLQKALDQAQIIGEKTEIGLIYSNMGNTFRQQGDPAQAEIYARQAATIFKQFSNSMGLAQALDNLGLACLDQSKWSEAIASFQTSLEIWRSLGSRQGELRTMIYILAYEVELGNWPQATAQLAEVDRLMIEYGQDTQHPLWRTLLDKCRERLKEGLQGSRNPGDPGG